MFKYVQEIIVGSKNILEGLAVSFASLFIRPITVPFPDVDIKDPEDMKKKYKGRLMPISENYRGILNVQMDICIACQLCMNACPINCIKIKRVPCEKIKVMSTTQVEKPKSFTSTRFDINIGKCMFCGLCVKPCPTGAIHHTKEFALTSDSLDKLVFSFVSKEEAEKAEQIAKVIKERKEQEKLQAKQANTETNKSE